MSYTRATALNHLVDEFPELAAQTGQADTDTSDGYGPALDKAFRALGTAETALPTATCADALVPALLALCEYHALARFWRKLATKTDLDARQTVSPRSMIFAQVRDLIADAKERCAAFGYPVDGSSGAWDYGRLLLDYIEPEPEDA